MGKGNRNRQNAARGVLAGAGVKTAGKKQSTYKTWVGTLIVVLVLLALIAVVVFSTLNSNGTFTRHKVMLSSEHYEITVADMSYLVYMQYENFVDTYGNTGYMSYIRGSGGQGLVTGTPLRDQIYSQTTDETTGEAVTVTWFDYFSKSALASAKELLSLCEGAHYYGITLDDEDQANIQKTLDTLEYYGEITGYGTNGYLRNMYGKGVRLSDVRHMLEMTTLASKYLKIGQQQAKASVTESVIDSKYENNRAQYEDRVDYMSVTFTTKFKIAIEEGDNASPDPAAENAENYEQYVNTQQKYTDRVNALAACADEEAFRALLKTYFKEDILAEDNTLDDAEADTQAEAKVDACEFVNVDQDNISDADAAAWLFAATARYLNDTTTMIDEDDARREGDNENEYIYEDTDSTYKALIVTSPLHTDTAMVRSVGHILFKTDSYSNITSPDELTGKFKELAQRVVDKAIKAYLEENPIPDGLSFVEIYEILADVQADAISAESMSHELLAQLLEEDKITAHPEGYYTIDESVFEEYGDAFTEDSNVFYDDVEVGEMVETFNDWLFDDARIEGEISYPDAIQTTYGYHIMYYRGNERPAWRAEVYEDLSSDAYSTWRDAAEAAYEPVVAEKIEKLWTYVGA